MNFDMENQQTQALPKQEKGLSTFNGIILLVSAVVGIGIFFKNGSVFKSNSFNG
jgi:hypothetical protein